MLNHSNAEVRQMIHLLLEFETGSLYIADEPQLKILLLPYLKPQRLTLHPFTQFCPFAIRNLKFLSTRKLGHHQIFCMDNFNKMTKDCLFPKMSYIFSKSTAFREHRQDWRREVWEEILTSGQRYFLKESSEVGVRMRRSGGVWGRSGMRQQALQIFVTVCL